MEPAARVRTCDLMLTRQLLCQLSYAGTKFRALSSWFETWPRVLPIALALSTAACQSIPAGSCSLLPLKSYTQEYSDKLAGEIEAAPEAVVWPEAVADYRALRKVVEACRGK